MSNYELYHQHPVNKFLHFICIPMIVLTSMNFLNNIYLCSLKSKFGYDLEINLRSLLLLVYGIHYLKSSWLIGITMMIYMLSFSYLSDYWQKRDKHWILNSLKLFTLAWIIQFIGHYIEGVRPALIDSLSSALFEAPLFSLNYIVPLLEN